MADTLPVAALALLTLAAAVYAHLRLPASSASHRQLWLTRLVLVGLGAGFGWAVVTVYQPVAGALKLWVWLASFGVVHVPAAVVLYIKQRRARS